MPIERRQFLRGVYSVLLLTSGALFAVSIDSGLPGQSELKISPTVLDTPRFSVRLGRNHLSLAGTTATQAHELALLQLVDDQFAGHVTQTDFSAGLFIPRAWDTLSARLLYLVAATDSTVASIDENGINIRGVTFNGPTYKRRLEFLESALPAGTSLNADVVIANADFSMAAVCLRIFSAMADRAVGFKQSSTEIRPASYPLLDRITEFAYDCRDPSIVITGHSDAAGSETRNLQVSRARAQAVADYLVRAGIATERLIVEGLGSVDPVADNATAHGRELNRRIEFTLR
jgi:OOP family OmpA-OmpF porin